MFSDKMRQFNFQLNHTGAIPWNNYHTSKCSKDSRLWLEETARIGAQWEWDRWLDGKTPRNSSHRWWGDPRRLLRNLSLVEWIPHLYQGGQGLPPNPPSPLQQIHTSLETSDVSLSRSLMGYKRANAKSFQNSTQICEELGRWIIDSGGGWGLDYG